MRIHVYSCLLFPLFLNCSDDLAAGIETKGSSRHGGRIGFWFHEVRRGGRVEKEGFIVWGDPGCFKQGNHNMHRLRVMLGSHGINCFLYC